MIKIAVCIKQVPELNSGDIGMNFATGLTNRSSLKSVINKNDLSAIETALRIKEQIEDCEIHTFTMAPETGTTILKEAYALGVDFAYLISDKNFSGADVVATAYTLFESIKSIGLYDIIICGNQTTDGDTGFVAGALANFFQIPIAYWVDNIKEITKEQIVITQKMEDYSLNISLNYPCVLAVDFDLYIPRLPSLKLKIQAKNKKIKVISLEDLQNKNINCYGVKGSYTKVKKIYKPKETKKQDVIDLNSDEAVHIIYDILKKSGDLS